MQGNLEWLQRQHLWLSVWDKSLSGAEVLLGQGELPILEACRASKVTFVQIVSRDVQLLNVSKFDAADLQAVPFGVALSLHGVPKTKM